MEIDLDRIEEKLKIQHAKRNKILAETKELDKIRKLPFHLQIQTPIFKERLKRLEKSQKETIFGVIKHREELQHLKGQEADLFADFWTEFLDGKVQSINDFFYIDRLNLEKGIKKEYKV